MMTTTPDGTAPLVVLNKDEREIISEALFRHLDRLKNIRSTIEKVPHMAEVVDDYNKEIKIAEDLRERLDSFRLEP